MPLKLNHEMTQSTRLFSLRHLIFNYIPKRLLLFALPLSLLVAFLVNDAPRRNIIIALVFFLGLPQIYNYFACWSKHRDLLERYGQRYSDKLNAELERVGFDSLLGRFWVGLKPD
jgi:hypothetical protein